MSSTASITAEILLSAFKLLRGSLSRALKASSIYDVSDEMLDERFVLSVSISDDRSALRSSMTPLKSVLKV